MNRASQPDPHPDVEILNAFAEQALAKQEHAQVLSHLSACDRCRLIVYLAQSAAASQQTETSQSPAVAQPLWTRNWRFAWVPVAALAAVMALALFLHIHRAQQGTEMAKLTPQPVAPMNDPQLNGSISKPSATQPPPPSPAPPTSSRTKKQATPSPAAAELAAPQAMSSAAFARQSEAYEPATAASVQLASPPTAYDGAIPSPDPSSRFQAEAPGLGTSAMQSSQLTSVPASQNRARSAKAASLARITPAAAAPVAQSGVQFASVARQILTLPSGLKAVSTAAIGQIMLAIDSAGSLYLWQDSGINWQPIATQWTGRAVQLHIAPRVRVYAAASTDSSSQQASGAAAPSSPATIFEIVNDKSQVWTSTDGKTWTAQ